MVLAPMIWRHVKDLWPRATLLPGAPFALWAGYSLARGERRWDIVLGALLAIGLAYTTARTRRVFVATLPLFLTAIAYDGQRFLGHLGLSEGRVLTCELEALDAAIFGVPTAEGRVSIPAWLQAHGSLALDVLASIPYGTYLVVVVGYALFLLARDERRLARFAWSFLALNLVAYVTYRVIPAAPPWYVHTHGCAVDLAARASEHVHLARVDELLGVHYFAGLYGRSRDVFGAIPSLHVGYPLLVVIESRSANGLAGRALAILFFVWMCFAAVYLDHHWVIDVVVGAACALAVHAAVRAVLRRVDLRREGVAHPGYGVAADRS